MFRTPHILAALVFSATTGLMATAAVAYDPCERAQRDVEEAEADVMRWYARNCPQVGTCSGSTRHLLVLGERVKQARARRSRACA
jgi:hypothetical protein